MDCTTTYLPYRQTGYFSKIITDYLTADEKLHPFYSHPVSIAGIKAAIEKRRKFKTDRGILVNQLQKQYSVVKVSGKVKANIAALGNENTFTICTAHQPNIFTGHLYFIYKILHAIRLAEELTIAIPGNNFVPVFYMGSEDADLDELGHIYLFGEKYEWNTKQTGAVGRMKVDKVLLQLIDSISGQLLVHPYGEAIILLLRECYQEGSTIAQASFKMVNALFAEYGLLVLQPDDAQLKKVFIPVVEKELATEFSHKAVAATVASFPAAYKVQASGRELNLFYLTDDNRERIEKVNGNFTTHVSHLTFTDTQINKELQEHPERFSPNVILRPAFQEMILPNIAFIGGGGEIAYWLELKKVFDTINVPFPVLVLRNSFMLISKEMNSSKTKLNFSSTDLFKKEPDLVNELVNRESKLQLSLEREKQVLAEFYRQLKNISGVIDTTLGDHTAALQANALKKIEALEKKMLKAERKKFEAQQRQLHKLKLQLFPHNSLQERVENILPFYANQGAAFIKMLYENSSGLGQEFCIVEEN